MKHLLAIVFLAPCLCLAQNSSLYFNHLTVNNGLSQGVAVVTLKDSRGFIWISTLDGIDRFDGIDTRHYDLSQLAAVNLTQTTTNFLEDRNGDIWAGTQHGLLKYNYTRDAFTWLPLDAIGINNKYSSPDIVRISYIDDKNRMWLNRENHFYCFDISRNTSRELQLPEMSRYPTFLVQQEPFRQFTNFYIADITASSVTIHQLNLVNDRLTWKTNNLENISSISTVAALPGGTFFLARHNQLLKYDFNTNQLTTLQQLNIKSTIKVLKPNGNLLWTGTESEGIISINSQTGQVDNWYKHTATNNHSLLFNNVFSMFIDDAANLWASVWGQGISYTNLTKFRMQQAFTKDEAQAHGCTNFIRSLGRDSHGDIWCNTGLNYLVRFSNKLTFKEKIEFPGVFSHFIIDKNDRIWFGMNDHLYSYTIATRQLRSTKNVTQAKTGSFNHITQLRNGSIVASCNSGVQILDKEGLLRPVTSLPGNRLENGDRLINMVFENKKRWLFVGIDRVGMEIGEPLGNNEYRIRKSFTFPGNVKCFYEQDDARLWIATTAGLILFNQQREQIERIFTMKDGLPNNCLYACLPDAAGNLWITSNKGVTAFNLRTYQCRNFNLQDGIQSNEFNSFAYLSTSDSALIFGGVNGLNYFHPSALSTYAHPATPQITSIKTDSLLNPFSFENKQSIILPYDQSGIEIGITSLEYANPVSNIVKYKLEGNDKQWTLSSNNSRIQYAHLDPGKYHFQLMAANCDGVWSNEIKTLTIVVLNPFWLTWWFITACIVFIMAGLYLLYRFRLHQVLRMERLRMRLATDLHDDIGSTLSSISMYSEAVKKQVKDKLPQLEPVLEKMGENSRKMVSSMSDIVWAVNPENDHGIRLIERMEAYARDACSVTDTRLHFSCHDRLRALPIPLEHRKNIYLVFKEALNNALKYAAAPDIWVTVTKEGANLHLHIQDNGKGFDTHKEYEGNGLKNLRMRTREINATLQINSSPNHGTTIDLYTTIT